MKLFSKSLFLQLVILLSAVLILQSCGDDPLRNSRERDFSTVPDPYDLSQADTSYTKEGGVEIYVIEEGEGPFEVIERDQITLYYTGRTSEGEIFQSTYANGNEQPAVIQNLTPVPKRGQQQTIPPQVEGFRRGLLGMHEGEKRVIIVPPELGYSNSNPGTNNMDLRDKELRYDVELVGIQ